MHDIDRLDEPAFEVIAEGDEGFEVEGEPWEGERQLAFCDFAGDEVVLE